VVGQHIRSWRFISFMALGILFYFGIVIVGTASYECPYQTSVSTALKEDGTIRKALANALPASLISLAHTEVHPARVGLGIPQHLRYPFSGGISPSRNLSGIRRVTRKVGHQFTLLPFRVFRTAKRGTGGFRCVGSFLVTIGDVVGRPLEPRGDLALRIRVRNLEAFGNRTTTMDPAMV
jgi:hypothetical protein